jgi:hypothetical protein
VADAIVCSGLSSASRASCMLSALWAALMFCYIYGDYFGLWLAGDRWGR